MFFMELYFEWDEAKNQKNQKKYDVSFETASLIFDDPLRISIQDRHTNGEERWQTIGMVQGVDATRASSSSSRRPPVSHFKVVSYLRRPHRAPNGGPHERCGLTLQGGELPSTPSSPVQSGKNLVV